MISWIIAAIAIVVFVVSVLTVKKKEYGRAKTFVVSGIWSSYSVIASSMLVLSGILA